MIRLPSDFREFLRLLNSHSVEYLLIGGYAVGYYGYPRATGDMDLWVSATAENARKVLAVMEDFGFSGQEASLEALVKPGHIVRMGIPPLRIELFTTISGREFSDCYGRRVTAIVDDVNVSFIALDDLRINKKASGRLKDLSDLEQLPRA